MLNRLALLCTTMLLSACAGAGAPDSTADFKPDPRPMGKTMVYDCSGYRFIARLGPGEMAIWFEDQYIILSQVRSGSGSRYQEGETVFWVKGQEALLEKEGRSYRGCRQMPALAPQADAFRRGVDFRATGNEPGWHLEITAGRHILFVTDYGERQVSVPDPGEVTEGASRIYHAVTEANDLHVEIVEELCLDTMADASYPNKVSVLLNGTAYRGCGQQVLPVWD